MRLNIPKKRNERQQNLDFKPAEPAGAASDSFANPEVPASEAIDELIGGADTPIVKTREEGRKLVEQIIRDNTTVNDYFGGEGSSDNGQGVALFEAAKVELMQEETNKRSESRSKASSEKSIEGDTEVGEEVTPEFIQWVSDHFTEACISVHDPHSTRIDNRVTLTPLEDDASAIDMLKRGCEVGFRFDEKPGVAQILKGRVVARLLYESFLSERDRLSLPRLVSERI
ncbi:hypothetical protein [Crateriforma conspicua]|uniref:hypothetical protein n=1 Tax=Crateriforma conspicua TaxID=2527996 RepID=UPI00118ADB73|nr:hypothetical protein [Crateriforma conspicua]QDV66086.1 hypothetical protein Mal65_52590 [Crateriforma conspicua]